LFAELRVTLFLGAPCFAAKLFQLGVRDGFALASPPVAARDRPPLARAIGALRRPQVLVAFTALARKGFPQPFPSSASLGLTFARTLGPLFEPGETLLQMRTPFRHLRMLYRDLGESVGGIQSSG
jgi:hypothetical protein